MTRIALTLAFALAALPAAAPLAHALRVGKKAPPFSLEDQEGESRSLKDYRGQWVVLEWLNQDCPFVRKHYDSGNMQSLQKRYTAKDVVWLSIVSSAPGRQGHMTSAEAASFRRSKKADMTAILLDPNGRVGRRYGAKTTPHMYVIDPKGRLVYQGAIDDKRSTNPDDIPDSRNHVAAALDEAMAGEEVSVADTKPYGCSVKYAK